MSVTPLWLAKLPHGQYQRVQTMVRRRGGGNMWVVSSWADLADATRRVMVDRSDPLTLSLATPTELSRLKTGLTVRGAFGGRLVESRPMGKPPSKP